MWEGKVFAAADTDTAETNWKQKVTPDRGELIRQSYNPLAVNMGILCLVTQSLYWVGTQVFVYQKVWYELLASSHVNNMLMFAKKYIPQA